MARRTLEDVTASEPDIDSRKLDATTEDDIRCYKGEDGYDFTPTSPARVVLPPQEIRRRLGMTQEEFAHALRIPVGTLRNWEQGRVMPDPAGRSLLNAVPRNPDAVLAALRLEPIGLLHDCSEHSANPVPSDGPRLAERSTP